MTTGQDDQITTDQSQAPRPHPHQHQLKSARASPPTHLIKLLLHLLKLDRIEVGQLDLLLGHADASLRRCRCIETSAK
jgi:hypothetical protein